MPWHLTTLTIWLRTMPVRVSIDTYFSIETSKQSIHNQQSSGRCWMFSGFNVLRANFAKRHQDTLAVEFSHAYLFFYGQLEKANLIVIGLAHILSFIKHGCNGTIFHICHRGINVSQ